MSSLSPNKFDAPMMATAFVWAKMSYCKRKKVGAVLSKNNRILATGYNGTVSGYINECEEDIDGELKTSEYTLHAEQNVLAQAAKIGVSTEGCSLYITTSPCKTCSKMIAQSGIKEVIYDKVYRDDDGINFLNSVGVKVRQHKIKI